MKRLILALAIIALSLPATFAQTGAKLTMFSEGGEPFYLMLNGVRQNAEPVTNLKVENLDQPYYKTLVIFADPNLGEIEKKMLMVSDAETGAPMSVTYQIKKGKKDEYVVKIFSYNEIDQPAAANSNVTVVNYNTQPMAAINFSLGVNGSATTGNTGSSVSVSETTTTTTTSGGTGGANINMDMNGTGMGVNVQIDDNMGGYSSSTTTTTTTTTTTSGSMTVSETNTGTAVNNGQCFYPMSGPDFSQAINSIESKNFSDDQMAVARQVINGNCLSTGQIIEMCELMSFEEEKLEIAKLGYAKCTDRNNYYQVNDVFSFSSSIDELEEHISR